MKVTSAFSVDGLTCGACLVEVIERLRELDGVDEVGIQLNVAGGSPAVVQSHVHISASTLGAAVAAAGFAVTSSSLDSAPTPRARFIGRDDSSKGDEA